MRVLFVTRSMPTGPVSGGLARSKAILAALEREHEVEVFVADRHGRTAFGRAGELARAFAQGEALQLGRYRTRSVQTALWDRISGFKPDVIHVDHIQLAWVLSEVDRPAVLDLHDVASGLTRGYAEQLKPGPMRWLALREADKLLQAERAYSPLARVVTLPSEKEAERLGTGVPVRNGFDVSRFDATPYPMHGPPSIVFVGLMSWPVNAQGAEWLVREVVPRLRTPDVRVSIVGKAPPRSVTDLAGPRVLVTGEVPDVQPYLERAHVSVAPLLTPGGTRLKILEGLASGRPVVATPEAVDGLEQLVGRGVVSASGPAAFAAAIDELLADPARAAELGRQGDASVRREFSWDLAGREMLDVYVALA